MSISELLSSRLQKAEEDREKSKQQIKHTHIINAVRDFLIIGGLDVSLFSDQEIIDKYYQIINEK